jgi:hypothetical protein
MADGEPEVVELFHVILACGTLGGRLTKDKTFFFKISLPASTCIQVRARLDRSLDSVHPSGCSVWTFPQEYVLYQLKSAFRS